MTKRKSTKRALLLSALSLLMCVSMLVGTTFAWFTDSVTSANNIIKSGNLDVELYYQAEGQSSWTEVDENTNIFMKDALWEPGHTEVVKLKVVNAGSLALKYQLGVNIASETGSVNVAGEAFKLSDYIKFGFVENKATYTRDEVVAAAEANNATLLKTPYATDSISLLPKTAANTDNEDIVTMVVYMPTTVGNEANHRTGEAAPTINLGINLIATQDTVEADSFNNEYDKDASYPGQANTASELIAALKAGQNVKLGRDIDLAGTTWEPIASYSGVFDGNGHTISNLKGENGLFDNLLGATVKNLNLENVDIDATSNHTGAVAGYINKSQGKQTVIENVTVSGTVNGGGYYVGGLIGADSNYDTVIRGCTNNATVVAPGQQVGGIVGYATRGTVVENCVNNGNITGGSFVGGIIGMAAGDDDMANLYTLVKGCTNTGAVAETATGPAVTWQGGVGGIIGNIGRAAGDNAVKELKFYIVDCTVAAGQAVYGQKHNVLGGHDTLLTVYVGDTYAPGATTAIWNEIKALGTNESKTFFLTDGEYTGDMKLTVADLGADKKGDLTFVAVPGTKPVLTGTVTMGYFLNRVGSEKLSAAVTFDGITFDHAEALNHSLDIQCVGVVKLLNCTVIGDGEYGIGSPGNNSCTPGSSIVSCTFVNAGIQVLGNFGSNMVIDSCTFNESVINIQGGNGVTVKNCTFTNTLTDAHNGESFYVIRSNAIPVTVTGCTFNIDSTVTGVGVAGSKGWGVFVNRQTANWTVTDTEVNMTAAALAQTALKVGAKLSTGKIFTTNLKLNGQPYTIDTL